MQVRSLSTTVVLFAATGSFYNLLNNFKMQTTKAMGGSGELIPILTQGDDLLVNARDLHSFLKVGKDFSNWIKGKIHVYGFKEHQDYTCIFYSPVLANQNTHGGDRRSIEYHLTLDMAKELAMVERNAMGRTVRQYFIEVERRHTSKRLYGQVTTMTELTKCVRMSKLNGRKMYAYRDIQRKLGLSTRSGTWSQKVRYDGQFVVWNGITYVSEEYAKLMISRSTMRVMADDARKAAPVLPAGYGQSMMNFEKQMEL